jgi:hypothetical protein
MVEECIKREQALTDEYHTRNHGKWNHMQSVYHIGFTNWNDEQCEYPVCHVYNPVRDSRLLASIVGKADWTGAHRWTRHVLPMNLCPQTNDSGVFEIANGGKRNLDYRIDWNVDWLEITQLDNEKAVEKNSPLQIEDTIRYRVRLLPEKWDKSESTVITIYGDNCEVVADESENIYNPTKIEIQVNVKILDISEVKNSCFLEEQGCISIEAVHPSENIASHAGEYKEIEGYGKTVGGMKAYPQTVRFAKEEDAPALIYRAFSADEGEYTCHIYASASNPVAYQGKMEVGVAANEGPRIIVNTIPDEGFVPWKSESWCRGVLDQIHIAECKLALKKGLNEIKLTAIDPAVVIEKIVLWNPNENIRDSYLGPKESKNYEFITK